MSTSGGKKCDSAAVIKKKKIHALGSSSSSSSCYPHQQHLVQHLVQQQCLGKEMVFNYHELMVNQPRDSGQRQFLFIGSFMIMVLLYWLLTSGAFQSVEIVVDEFPGGTFVYKKTARDYAAAESLSDFVANETGVVKRKEQLDSMYTIYLDDPAVVGGGRRQRFAAGYLQRNKRGTEITNKLLKRNDQFKPVTANELQELGAHQLWARLKYESKQLPAVKAAVIHFPYTEGFVSALVFTMKILPALRKHAAKAGANPVTIISTCGSKQKICTHYAPLQQERKFLLGEPDMETYVASLEPEGFNLQGAFRTIKKLLPFSKYFLGDSNNDEL